jgi:hypothetical protein
MATFTAVNDNNVVQVVLGVTEYWKKELGKTVLDAEVLQYGWQYLKRARRTPKYAADIDLAAAEHYMFAAYSAAATGDPTVALTPILYETKKRVYFWFGKQDALRTDPRFPVVPPNDDVEAWGIAGAQYGLNVFKEQNPGAGWQYGAAVGSFASDAGYGDKVGAYFGKSAVKFGTILKKYR